MTDEVEAPTSDDEERYPDPHGLYRRWFGVLESLHEATNAGTLSPDELKGLWRRWFEAAAGAWNGSTKTENDFVGGMAPLWAEMAEDISAKMLSGETLPEDPMRFFVRWYNDTSESWSERADELLKKEEVLESNGRFFETYARSHGELRRVSEEGLESLRIPTRSDIARVARLVVGVENKLDRMEEVFEESVGGLEERVDRLERKMDRLLAVLEKLTAGEEPNPAVGITRRSTAEGKADDGPSMLPGN